MTPVDKAERDRIMRELDVGGFHAMLLRRGLMMPWRNAEHRPRDEITLAAIHKARIVWTGATPEMVRESRSWLAEKGFSPPP